MERTRSDLGRPGAGPADAEGHSSGEPLAIADQPLISRRAVIGGGLAGLGGLFLFPAQMMAAAAVPSDPFVVLLQGLYQPVVRGPRLGLSAVDLDDGSYSTTSIYPVSGLRGHPNRNKSVGTFYVQFDGDLCAYHLAGGSLAMRFTGSDYVFVDDGAGGQFLEGTFELTILEATGVYRPYVGGHNHMVDRLHFLASGGVNEYCFCFISRP
ncbi:MAG TPA: hypothetical protein VM427_06920 [Patescibacteria group bacterium]|nr:hypothetical protein [Patescibacteria group bacterium]